jgi:hypothetical protein
MIFPAEAASKRMSFPELNTSLKVPIFNQRRKIPYSLKKIKQAVEPAVSSYELIVINDGGMDNNNMTILERHSNDR